jgi:ankyrin repeat protein
MEYGAGRGSVNLGSNNPLHGGGQSPLHSRDTLPHSADVGSAFSPSQNAPLLSSTSPRSAALDESDQLPMHSAAYFGKFSVLSELMNRMPKNSVEIRDSNGNTVLHYCTEGGDRSLGCLALLLNNKQVDRDAQNDLGHTALHIAALRGLENAMHALLLSGVKRDLQDANGDTPMHCAGMNRQYKCLELLVQHGGSVSSKNRRGLTPADVTPPPSEPLCVAKTDCCSIS